MKKKTEWFTDNTFWIQYAPIFFDSHRWAEAPATAEAVLQLIGSPQQAKILDAGCGPGRIAIELAIRGAQVTGIDLVPEFLNAARESANAENVSLELIQQDLRNFSRSQEFDAAINLYSGFGYCNSIKEDALILKNIATSLKKDGYFILETIGKEIAARDFVDSEWFERDNFLILTEYRIKGAWETLHTRIILIDEHGNKCDKKLIQRLYSAVELKNLFLEAGFTAIKIYGDFNCAPYNEKAKTMLVIGKI